MPGNPCKPNNQTGKYPKIVLAGATLAVLLVGVYAMFDHAGNDRPPTPATSSSQPDQTATARDKPHRLDRSLSTGAMAAFVFKQDRPAVETGEFRDATENAVSIGNWTGRVALINLWATWCAPCRKEMPHLAELQKLYGSDDFEVIAISVDLKGAKASADFLQQIGATDLALYVDKTTRVMKKLGAIGLPLTILVDRNGREVGRLLGPADWTSDEARSLIEAAIAENQKAQ
jgi:thiol-disulfide isomerase/thioredoxin